MFLRMQNLRSELKAYAICNDEVIETMLLRMQNLRSELKAYANCNDESDRSLL
jgi:hypothetical protein